MHRPADNPYLCASMCLLTSGCRIWLSQRLPKAAKAEFRKDTEEQTVGIALEDVEMVMKKSFLYIFRAAISSFMITGGNGSCSGTGPGEDEQHSRLGSICLLQAPRQWCLLPTFRQESSGLFESFNYLSKIYPMPRSQ